MDDRNWKRNDGLNDDDAKRMDCANLIGMGMGVLSTPAARLAYAFMTTREIIIPENRIKANRKAAREMLEMKVTPANIVEATQKLIQSGMTVVDLFSVSKTAISLANPIQEDKGMNPQNLEVGL